MLVDFLANLLPWCMWVVGLFDCVGVRLVAEFGGLGLLWLCLL